MWVGVCSTNDSTVVFLITYCFGSSDANLQHLSVLELSDTPSPSTNISGQGSPRVRSHHCYSCFLHTCVGVSSSKSSDHPRIVLPDGGSEADPESDGL